MRFDLWFDDSNAGEILVEEGDVLAQRLLAIFKLPFFYKTADAEEAFICCDLTGYAPIASLRAPTPVNGITVFGFPFEVSAYDDPAVADSQGFCFSPKNYISLDYARRDVTIVGDEAFFQMCAHAMAQDVGLTVGPPGRMIESGDDEYRARFSRLSDFFSAGDFYQIVLARTSSYQTVQAPLELFFESRKRYSDARYSYYFATEGETVFGNCSLPHLEVAGGRLATEVFAGTYPRGETERSADFFSEHVMLVDVERNDFCNIGVMGSMEVKEFMSAIDVGATRYLRTRVEAARDLNRKLFSDIVDLAPRGVVIGAPKSSVIEEIRCGGKRGWYAGVVGIRNSVADSLRSNIIVSCAISSEEGRYETPVGSGVLHNTQVENELEELNLKRKILHELFTNS